MGKGRMGRSWLLEAMSWAGGRSQLADTLTDPLPGTYTSWSSERRTRSSSRRDVRAATICAGAWRFAGNPRFRCPDLTWALADQ